MYAVELNRWGLCPPLHFREMRKVCVIKGANPRFFQKTNITGVLWYLRPMMKYSDSSLK